MEKGGEKPIKKFLIGIASAVFMLGASIVPAFATVPWSLTAPKPIVFSCGGTDYPHTLQSVLEDTSTGNFSGTGSYDTDTSYTWNINGNITGSSITFTILYTGTNAGYTLHGTGTIAGDGSINGTVNNNCQTFSMGPGSATAVVVGPPTNKAQCKDGGWKTFNNPSFKNQDQCVDYVHAHQKKEYAKLVHVGLNPSSCTGPFTGKSEGEVRVKTSTTTGVFKTRVDVDGAMPNSTYDVDIRCVSKIGTVTTNKHGDGTTVITMPTTPSSPFWIDISIPGGGAGAGGYG